MSDSYEKALMYGAGSIGRGFIGPLFSSCGCRVCFVDVDRDLVERLNIDTGYEITIAEYGGYETRAIKNVYAIDGTDSSAVSREIAGCDIMSTAVGVNILPKIAKTIAEGLDIRASLSKKPLDIIDCENIANSGGFLKSLVKPLVKNKEYLEESIGFASSSVGRMVPLPPESHKSKIVVEPYNRLPVDGESLKTDVSKIENIIPVTPFAIEEYKNYFMHNMSHAIVAYMGYLEGYEFIWEAVRDNRIRKIVSGALEESIKAISSEFTVSETELKEYANDLLKRYSNAFLKDTVARVGRDPKRKLSRNDRLAGAALFCLEKGIMPHNIIYGIAAAFKFDAADDISAPEVSDYVAENGMEKAVAVFTGIKRESPLFNQIIKTYKGL